MHNDDFDDFNEYSVHPPKAAPSRLKELCSLQLLRGVAAFGVVLYHATLLAYETFNDTTVPVVNIGQAGVDLFFVISGFIMYYISAKKPRRPLDFYKARIQRIVPLYWITTFAMFVMPLVSKTIGWSSNLDPVHLITSLFFIGGHYTPALDTKLPVLRPGWTLNYEMFFYLIFGAGLALGTAKKSLLVTIPIISALSIVGLFVGPKGNSAKFYTNPLMLEFVYGLIVAVLVLSGRVLPKLLAALVVICGCILAFMSSGYAENSNFLFWGLSAAGIVYGLVSLELRSEKPWDVPFKIFGDASYSIYLTHLFAQGVTGLLWQHVSILRDSAHPYGFIITASAASLILGVGCYYLIEQPLIRVTHFRVPKLAALLTQHRGKIRQ
jgi:exopolysaccharide production protein ExoZ